MNSEVVIEVKNIRKKFKVYFDKGYGLKEKFFLLEEINMMNDGF